MGRTLMVKVAVSWETGVGVPGLEGICLGVLPWTVARLLLFAGAIGEALSFGNGAIEALLSERAMKAMLGL